MARMKEKGSRAPSIFVLVFSGLHSVATKHATSTLKRAEKATEIIWPIFIDL